jgi:hypothetical protein
MHGCTDRPGETKAPPRTNDASGYVDLVDVAATAGATQIKEPVSSLCFSETEALRSAVMEAAVNFYLDDEEWER